MDETGRHYHLLPRQTCMQKKEKSITGTKSMKAKDQITLYICTNATRSQKVPLSTIVISKNPNCFGRYQGKRKFTHFDQEKAWYSSIF
jgi:hypothetical protein